MPEQTVEAGALTPVGAELFRLTALRPPSPATGRVPRVVLAPAAPDSRGAGTELVISATGGLRALSVVIGTDVEFPFHDLDMQLTQRRDRWSAHDIDGWVHDWTGHHVREFVGAAAWTTHRQQVHTGLVDAITTADGGALADLPTATALLRACRLVGMLEAVAGADPAVRTAEDVHNYLAYSTVQLPDGIATARPSPLARPPAVADLKVVKLGPAKYEASDIAYIENVMAREKRKRTFTVHTEDETTMTTTTQRTEENEHDLTTTSQVQLQQEASQIIQSSTDLEAGLHVSASYGPTVSVSADARVARHDSSESTNREAASYANSITQQARQRVVESTTVTRTERRLLVTDDANVHGFDNTAGEEHIVGVYRHVDQVQDAWTENYGKRLMLEFLVPEPAAVLQWALTSTPDGDADPEPPRPADPEDPKQPLLPSHINEMNYLKLVGTYGASDVSPPPPDSIELAVTFQGDPGQKDLFEFNDSKTMKVPVGYRATRWVAQCVTWGKDTGGDPNSWMVGVGQDAAPAEENTDALHKFLSGDLDAAENSIIPVVMQGRHLINMSASVRIHCVRTVDNLNDWKLKVYQKIMSAWTTAHQDWAARAARAQALARANEANTQPQGGADPDANRAVERRELRRGVIHLLLGGPQDSGLFTPAPVSHPADHKRPGLDLDAAARERDAIAFFEQAFEWTNMTWLHYPYYWAAAERWAQDIRLSSADPQWAAFLTAGATRVVVPVRPGFEWAIGLYLSFGVIWSGGAVPTVSDPAYLGIAEEIAESLGAGQVEPQVTPLQPVRLPTSLVWLQPTSALNPAPAAPR